MAGEVRRKAFMNWSSGKDSAMALHRMQEEGILKVETLFTTLNSSTDRVSMHGLHRDLLTAQAKAIDLPIEILELPALPNMEDYNALMKARVELFKNSGYDDCAFGDIFLEDLKNYREQQLNSVSIKAHFPLWKSGTKELMQHFFEKGFRAVVVAANAKWFSQDFVGSELTPSLIDNLPEGVDPCGENGEFHTFCFDGPIFHEAVDFKVGEKLYKSYPNPENSGDEIGFWFCDLVLA